MKKVFSFGELLLRMSPELGGQWIQHNRMPVYVGGAELNVATALAKWDVPVKYCSALPDNIMSKEILEELRNRDIDTSSIKLQGNRIGVYYLPQGLDLKNAGVIYDRAQSSFSELKPGMIDWDRELDDCNWFHFSAISPALNNNLAAVCKEALEAAERKKLKISIDLNYRSKLWKYGKSPLDIMPSLVNHCDVVMGNIWSAHDLLGIAIDDDINKKGDKAGYLAHSSSTARELMNKFPKCGVVANTFRFDAGEGIVYYAALEVKGSQFVSPEFAATKVIDKVGSGDCFMAGLIYGLYNGNEHQELISFAAAAAFGKLQEMGDSTSQEIKSIKKTIETYGTIKVSNR